jgi:hypothetical protein
MFTLAVLSWSAHKTLRNTLESYKTFGLDKLAKQKLIFFQEISPVDLQIAQKYGYTAIGDKTNIGIAQGYKRLVDKSTQPFFLFLENDWVLLEKPDQQIQEGINLLDRGIVNVVRYRHRRFPGDPLWTRQFKDNEYERPTHLLDCVHWTENPNEKFPEIHKRSYDALTWYMADAGYANWTNNPTLFKTEFLQHIIMPRIGSRDAEVDLQDWWAQQRYWVAQSDGLFTHRRVG